MTQFQSTYSRLVKQLTEDPKKTENIIAKVDGSQIWITLNRPKKMNAFTMDMYIYITELIRKANQMPEIKFIVITGAGGNFCSGNDLMNFVDPRMEPVEGEKREDIVAAIAVILQNFCSSLIESEKPIFGLAEGKVIGFAFTQLALYDKVFVCDNCEYMAPLVKISQGPEMCSSYLFTKVFGKKLAQELVIEGRTVKSDLVQKYGLVESYPNIQAAKKALLQHLANLQELEWMSYLTARKLFNDPDRQQLREINKKQCENLVHRWNNPNLVEFLMNYMQKQKSKKNK